MIDGIWLLLRASGLVLSLQAAGAGLFDVLYARLLQSSATVVRSSARRAAVLAVAVLIAQLLMEPIELGGELRALTDLSVSLLFLSSSAAAALLVRLAGAACLATGLRAGARRTHRLALLGSFLIVASFPLSGHTAAAAQRLWLAALLVVHVAIVAFWFGSLRPLRQMMTHESRATASSVLRTFSALAVWLVPTIALAGAGMATMLLPDYGSLLRPYGLLILTKIALFAALMGLAALNRMRLAVALAAGARTAAAALRCSMALEYALICVVLTVTAVMTGHFSPADRQSSREPLSSATALA